MGTGKIDPPETFDGVTFDDRPVPSTSTSGAPSRAAGSFPGRKSLVADIEVGEGIVETFTIPDFVVLEVKDLPVRVFVA
nr:Hypothetical protein RNGR00178 [Sinorhizobium fredii NGR234]